MRRETFVFGDWVRLILYIWRYFLWLHIAAPFVSYVIIPNIFINISPNNPSQRFNHKHDTAINLKLPLSHWNKLKTNVHIQCVCALRLLLLITSNEKYWFPAIQHINDITGNRQFDTSYYRPLSSIIIDRSNVSSRICLSLQTGGITFRRLWEYNSTSERRRSNDMK